MFEVEGRSRLKVRLSGFAGRGLIPELRHTAMPAHGADSVSPSNGDTANAASAKPGQPIKQLAAEQGRAGAIRTSKGSKQLAFGPATALLLPVILFLGWLSAHLHYSLPTPQQDLFLADGITPVFSEREALRYINDLATHEDGSPRYRIVGTKEMVLTEEYLLKEVDRIRQEVVARMPAGLHQIEVWHQVSDCQCD